MPGRLLRFPLKPISSEEGVEAAHQALATPRENRPGHAIALRLEEPETLLQPRFRYAQPDVECGNS